MAGLIPYITHHDFNEKAICGETLNLPRGTKVLYLDIDYLPDGSPITNKPIVTYDGKAICLPSSENGKKHFARNDDGRGLERGDLTYAIAYAPRQKLSANGSYYRFSDDEADMIFEEYEKWIRPGIDVILFNDDFFRAEIDDLKELAERLEI